MVRKDGSGQSWPSFKGLAVGGAAGGGQLLKARKLVPLSGLHCPVISQERVGVAGVRLPFLAGRGNDAVRWAQPCIRRGNFFVGRPE